MKVVESCSLQLYFYDVQFLPVKFHTELKLTPSEGVASPRTHKHLPFEADTRDTWVTLVLVNDTARRAVMGMVEVNDPQNGLYP